MEDNIETADTGNSHTASSTICIRRIISPVPSQMVPALALQIQAIGHRSCRLLTITANGSLLTTAGTFGWKLTTKKNITLYHGADPIEIGSSTQSQLRGFTAPLLLITLLAWHWGMRHRCKFRWLVESQVAINRVTFVTLPQPIWSNQTIGQR